MIRDAKSCLGLYDTFLAGFAAGETKKLISDEQWADLKSVCIYHRQLLGHRAEYASAGTARKFRILFPLWRSRRWHINQMDASPLDARAFVPFDEGNGEFNEAGIENQLPEPLSWRLKQMSPVKPDRSSKEF